MHYHWIISLEYQLTEVTPNYRALLVSSMCSQQQICLKQPNFIKFLAVKRNQQLQGALAVFWEGGLWRAVYMGWGAVQPAPRLTPTPNATKKPIKHPRSLWRGRAACGGCCMVWCSVLGAEVLQSWKLVSSSRKLRGIGAASCLLLYVSKEPEATEHTVFHVTESQNH